jgi:hypothetical protein
VSLKLTSSWFDITVAVIGAITIVIGVFWVYPPAGIVLAGIFLVVFAYLRRALEVLNGDS